MTAQLQANIGDKAVTVQVLRVGGKKMPRALFRQIPIGDCQTAESCFDTNLKPPGRVAYKIPKEGDEWLLAERAGQLVCCCLDLPDLSEWYVGHHEMSLAEAEEKMKHAEALGSHGAGLPTLYRSTIERHREERPKARAKLITNKFRHAALTKIKALPQLFLASSPEATAALERLSIWLDLKRLTATSWQRQQNSWHCCVRTSTGAAAPRLCRPRSARVTP